MQVSNVIVISDTHFGCKLGLCPPKVKLDDGGYYEASELQSKVWQMWKTFWSEWVPRVTKGEPYVLVHNGDVMDGIHHNSVTQISHNLTDQKNIALQAMAPIIKNPKCVAYYQVRGTEAHVGKSGQDEEDLAKQLGAEVDEYGAHSVWELWLKVGNKKRKILIHFTHHVGTTNSASYESTAVHKELIEALTESGRWKNDPPDAIVRSHRHRHYKVELAAASTNLIGLVTPSWQLKTPFSFRGTLGRASSPQIGGCLIRCGDEDDFYERHIVWQIERPRTVVV